MRLYKTNPTRNIKTDEFETEITGVLLPGDEIPCCEAFHEWLAHRRLL